MKSVLFDLGNTVFRIDFDLCLQAWARSAKKPEQEISKAYAFDDAYDAHEKNEITGPEYYLHVMKLFGAKMSFQEFVDGWNAIYLDLIPETVAFIEKYAGKTRIFALTNSNEIHRPFWSKKYATVLSKFEKIYCSSQIDARKPSAAAYEFVLSDAKLAPSQVVFADDLPENIEGAELVGILAVHFVNPKAAIARIEALL